MLIRDLLMYQQAEKALRDLVNHYHRHHIDRMSLQSPSTSDIYTQRKTVIVKQLHSDLESEEASISHEKLDFFRHFNDRNNINV